MWFNFPAEYFRLVEGRAGAWGAAATGGVAKPGLVPASREVQPEVQMMQLLLHVDVLSRATLGFVCSSPLAVLDVPFGPVAPGPAP